ncbi:MAG TPA: alpha/beta hydrolase [Chthoniobacterales bacterium]
MSTNKIKVGRENSTDIELYYEDHGDGRPVVLIHAWPLDGRSWEKQTSALLKAGYRVIAYDRRGFGGSSRPSSGYDVDTLAADLHTLVTTLDLRDLALVGYSMGGGEVARYLGTYGSERVKKAVLIGSVTPFLLKTPDNPGGVDGAIFDGIQQALTADRFAFLPAFLRNFYNADVLEGKLISKEVLESNWNVAVDASPIATCECVSAWLGDFRKDLASFDIPTLILHGGADRSVPISVSGEPTHALVKHSRLVVIKDAPHGLTWTHAEEVNRELLSFLGS